MCTAASFAAERQVSAQAWRRSGPPPARSRLAPARPFHRTSRHPGSMRAQPFPGIKRRAQRGARMSPSHAGGRQGRAWMAPENRKPLDYGFELWRSARLDSARTDSSRPAHHQEGEPARFGSEVPTTVHANAGLRYRHQRDVSVNRRGPHRLGRFAAIRSSCSSEPSSILSWRPTGGLP
jgi:hypothetical protein